MKEVRVIEIRATAPSADGGEAMIIKGRPIVYETPTEIHDLAGSYTEVIKRGALDKADLSDVRLLVNHDQDKIPLARVPKTMSLTVDDDGLLFEATLPDTEAGREVYEAVRRGDLSGMSFAFTVPDGGDYYDARANVRTITQINKVYECSIVSYPAYESTYVSVEARSVRLAGQDHEQARRRAKILCNQILRVRC